jgi:hypothetical protein
MHLLCNFFCLQLQVTAYQLLQQIEDGSCRLRAASAAARNISSADAGLLLDDACEARDEAQQLLAELSPR